MRRPPDQGWNVERDGERLTAIVAQPHRLGIRVSVFMDPDIAQIERVPATGADRIELYTEPYARSWGTAPTRSDNGEYAAAARRAQQLGLGVNAGHDLNLANLRSFLPQRARRPRSVDRPCDHRRRAGDGLDRRGQGVPGRAGRRAPMITGIGTDLIAIDRIGRIWTRHRERLCVHILSPEEQDEFRATAAERVPRGGWQRGGPRRKHSPRPPEPGCARR